MNRTRPSASSRTTSPTFVTACGGVPSQPAAARRRGGRLRPEGEAGRRKRSSRDWLTPPHEKLFPEQPARVLEQPRDGVVRRGLEAKKRHVPFGLFVERPDCEESAVGLGQDFPHVVHEVKVLRSEDLPTLLKVLRQPSRLVLLPGASPEAPHVGSVRMALGHESERREDHELAPREGQRAL